MQPAKDGFSLVLVGSWNPAIFNPKWVGHHLLPKGDDDAGRITMAFPIGNPDAPPQLRFAGIQLYPSTGRLEFRPDEQTPQRLGVCVSFARRCLELLEHTPVTAVGINFTFDVSGAFDAIAPYLQFADADRVDADKYALTESRLQRVFRTPSKAMLRLLIHHSADSKIATVSFNFHNDISSMQEGKMLLSDQIATERHREARDFMKTVYNLE